MFYNKYKFIKNKTLIYSSLKNFIRVDLNKDYYKILELTPNATDKDIKNAYLKCVKKYHPDLNEGKTTEIFKEISNSFIILSDAEKKRYYDSNSLRSSEYNFNYTSFDEERKKQKEKNEDYNYEDFDFENRQKFYEKKKYRQNKDESNYESNHNIPNNDYWKMMVFYFKFFRESIEENPQYIPRFFFFLFLYFIYKLVFRKEHRRYHLFESF